MPDDGFRRISTPTKALRVLVVEDDALIAMMYADLLTELGHIVCATVGSEADAVAAAACHKPDLIIADMGLRDGSGISAITEILRGGFIPHLFVTGDARAVQALRPAAVILEKPFNDPQLARAIQRALAAIPAI